MELWRFAPPMGKPPELCFRVSQQSESKVTVSQHNSINNGDDRRRWSPVRVGLLWLEACQSRQTSLAKRQLAYLSGMNK